MNRDIWRYYIQVAFTEDGYAPLEILNNKYLRLKLGIGRSVDITEHIDKNKILNLLYGSTNLQYAIKNKLIDKNFLDIIFDNPPKLLLKETAEFKRRHPDIAKLIPKIRPKLIYRRKDNRVTVVWRFHVSNKKVLDVFYNNYGMLPHSKKNEAFVARYKFYKKYGGKRIDKDIYAKYKILIEKYPYKITKEYTIRKFHELFGDRIWK